MKKSIKYLLSLMFIVVVFLPMNAKAAAGLCAFGATDPTTCCSSTTSSGQCTDTPPLKWNVKVNVPDDSCQQDSYVTGKLTAATLANKQYNCGTDTSPCRTGHADCSGTCLVIQTDDGDVAPGDGYVDGLTCAAAHRSFSSCTGKCGTCLSSYADVSGACTLVNPMEVLQVGSSWYGVESDLSNYSSYLTRLIGGGSSQWTTSGNDIYNSNTGNVGIGTTTPTAKLDIAVPSTYTGAVFKAGYNINPLTTPGNYSVAMGVGTRAAGNRSTAMGYMSYASGLNSTAMGYMSYASGLNSTAMGDTTSAGGTDSTAMGWNTKANWSYATAMGNTTTASGDTSTAMGWNTIASALASTAMGQLTVASGNMSTAMGWSTTAQPFASESCTRTLAPVAFFSSAREPI